MQFAALRIDSIIVAIVIVIEFVLTMMSCELVSLFHSALYFTVNTLDC